MYFLLKVDRTDRLTDSSRSEMLQDKHASYSLKALVNVQTIK